ALEGIPGSGKTSTTISIAADLQMNICIINLNNVDDESFSEAMNEVPPRSIILLEDADCAIASGSREKNKEGSMMNLNQPENSKLSLSGLLNAIDGVASPDGTIIFITTNHIDKIDPALLRPGRIDKIIHYTFATRDQIFELAKRFRVSDDT